MIERSRAIRTLLGAVAVWALTASPAAPGGLQRCGDTFPLCPTGEYCRQLDGTCAGDGFCETIPASCAPDDAPVCACSGTSYPNVCEARLASDSIDTAGPCPADDCGGDLCTPDEYCDRPVGGCEAPGACVPRPTTCPDEQLPVCACDGVGQWNPDESYWNPCEAQRAGKSIASIGSTCPGDGCGNRLCAEDEYCNRTCWDGYDVVGPPRCDPKPTVCPPVDDPVCGCDGVDYPNSCEAAAASMAVFLPSACPDSCGGLFGDPCDDPLDWCVADLCCCDVPGICIDPVTSCEDTCKPYCGCDDTVYRNYCELLLTGAGTVDADEPGACDEVRQVQFISKSELVWTARAAAQDHNVYRSIRAGSSAPGSWDCLVPLVGADVETVSIADAPPAGELWMIGLTGIHVSGEKSLGMVTSSACVERQIVTPCLP